MPSHAASRSSGRRRAGARRRAAPHARAQCHGKIANGKRRRHIASWCSGVELPRAPGERPGCRRFFTEVGRSCTAKARSACRMQGACVKRCPRCRATSGGRRRRCRVHHPASILKATWRSGDATDCKSVHPGSIPGVASSLLQHLLNSGFGRKLRCRHQPAACGPDPSFCIMGVGLAANLLL